MLSISIYTPGTATCHQIDDFYNLWHSKQSDEYLPSRQDLSLDDLHSFMGNIAVVDVIEGGKDFRFRIVGADLIERSKRDYTGQLLSESYYPDHVDIAGRLREPLKARTAVYTNSAAVFRNKDHSNEYEILRVPLAGDGTNIDMIMSLVWAVEDTSDFEIV